MAACCIAYWELNAADTCFSPTTRANLKRIADDVRAGNGVCPACLERVLAQVDEVKRMSRIIHQELGGVPEEEIYEDSEVLGGRGIEMDECEAECDAMAAAEFEDMAYGLPD